MYGRCAVDNRKSILQIQVGLQIFFQKLIFISLQKQSLKNDGDDYDSKGHRSNSKQKINNSKIKLHLHFHQLFYRMLILFVMLQI